MTSNPADLLADLNDAQCTAVLASTGPVAILAGAGTGKTTVISRRAAYAIATGVVPATQALVVTFTDKAAGEMVARLAALGLPGVTAKTFHAQALSQLRYFWPRLHDGRPLPEVLGSKAAIISRLARDLPGGYRFTAAKDLADEIEWAKSRRIGPREYAASAAVAARVPPIPAELMGRLYADYERAKDRAGKLDFDDMLIRTVELLEEDDDACAVVRSRKRWISVDEYQDTNPLQEDLLALWLGESRDLCVVGDEDQTIYTFTGATSRFLTDFAERHPGATVVSLGQNYRSSPQVLDLANRLIAGSGRSRPLSATRPPGPPPEIRRLADEDAELAMLATRIAALVRDGTKPAEIAVLVRMNAQLALIEQALTRAGIAYVVRGIRFFARRDTKAAIDAIAKRAPKAHGAELGAAIRVIWATELGFESDDGGGSGAGGAGGQQPGGNEARERQAGFETLLEVFHGLARVEPDLDVERYLAELAARAEHERAGSDVGVNLLTYHRAKGLEWDAVFLPMLEEGSLPIHQAIGDAVALDEERRLLYVGITRARRHLVMSHAERRIGPKGGDVRRARSRFLDDLVPPPARRAGGVAGAAAGVGSGRGSGGGAGSGGSVWRRSARTGEAWTAEPGRSRSSPGGRVTTLPDGFQPPQPKREHDALYDALVDWRAGHAHDDAVPAYVIAPNETLAAIAEARPKSIPALRRVKGMGPARLERFGDEILAIVAQAPRPGDLR